ncbi:helix-turn-helix domain-containing protein [Faecalimonas sp.]
MTYISTKLKKEFLVESIITVHYFEYMNDFIFSGESHNFWEFLYVDKGTVSVQANDRQYTLSAGDIIFHKPNEFHAIQSISKKAPNLIAISFDCHSPSIRFFYNFQCTLTLEERILISKIITEAKNTFSSPLHIPSIEQVQLCENAPFGAQQLISLYLELLLITLKRNHLENPVMSSRINSSIKDNLPEEISSFMKRHICDNLTISSICKTFSISRSVLHTIFTAKHSCSPMAYFQKLKIDYAKELLRSQKMNCTEVAHHLSFSSLQYFSKQFKKAVGMSPSEYISSVKGISHL